MTTQRPTNTTFSTFIDDYIKGQKAVRHSLRVKQMLMLDNMAWQDNLAEEIDRTQDIIDRCEAARFSSTHPVVV